MKSRSLLLTLVAGFFMMNTANADVNAWGVPLRVSADGSVAYSSASVPDGASNPNLVQYGFGVTGTYNFYGDLLAGLTSDFRFISQYSSTSASNGNFRGHRWNIISPVFGGTWMKATILADFQFLGAYNIYASASNGGDVKYTGPLGGRVRATYPVFDKFDAGLVFEYLTFGTRHNSISGDTSLSSKQKLWQLGLTASYVF